jgi:hypothetical protein
MLENTQISNLMQIRPVTAEMFHADRRTDGWTDRRTDRHDEANRRFSQFYERTYPLRDMTSPIYY